MGMDKRIIFLFVVVLVGLVYADDLVYYDGECNYDGSGLVRFNSYNSDVRIYTNDVNLKASYLLHDVLPQDRFDLKGNWNGDYFLQGDDTSKELISYTVDYRSFNKKGSYLIEANYTLNNVSKIVKGKLDCPGFFYSCNEFYLEIINCTTKDNKDFESYIIIKGLNQSIFKAMNIFDNVGYTFNLDKRYTDKLGKFSNQGSLPLESGFSILGNDMYLLRAEFDNNFVKSFNAKFLEIQECLDKTKYPNLFLFSYKECSVENDIAEDIFVNYGNVSEFIEEQPLSVKSVDFDLENDKDEERNGFWSILLIFFGFLVILIIIKRLINHRKS